MSDVDAELREKITSKMTVATFLAGFTFAALLQLLNDPTRFQSTPNRIAVISLTLALSLFVAAVYMYDRLSMPRHFWRYDPAEVNQSQSKKLIERLHFKVHLQHNMLNDGARYTYMIGIWQWVFTPAVCAAVVGFSAVLYGSNDRLVFWTSIVVIVVVAIYYVVLRPILGKVD